MKNSQTLITSILLLFVVTSFAQPIAMDDSLFQVQTTQSFPTQASSGNDIMEQQLLGNQFRIFLYQNGYSFEDKGIQEKISLKVYMNSQNEVVAITHKFMEMVTDGNVRKIISISPTKRDSLVELLNLNAILEQFANELTFKRKYIGNHSHFLSSSIGFENRLGNNKSLENILSQDRADTVTTLDLKGLGLKNLNKKDIRKFKSLKSLQLAENQFSGLPKWISKLKNLERLDLSGNYLTAERVKFGRNKKLHTLNFQNNGFRTLPKSLKKLNRLDNLLVGNNSLFEIDNFRFDKLKSLKNLNFYNANLDHLPPYVLKCKKLEELDLYFNYINFLPKEIYKLQKLKTLAVSYNGMWSLPEEIREMSNLKTLFAHHNDLERLPILPQSIVELDIGYNKFKAFPPNISNYPNLKTLDFNQNNLESSFDQSLLPPNLKNLFIYSNPFFTLDNKTEASVDFVFKLQEKGIQVN